MAENFCKYYKLIRQVSYNGGQTWSNVDPPQYHQGDLYEEYSADCVPDAMYRWVVLDESETMCEDGIGHYVEYRQVSYDYGATWINVEPEETQLGAEKPLEESMDCFKYYCNNGNPYLNQYWDDCGGIEDIYLASFGCQSYYDNKIPYIPDYTTGQYDVYVGNCVVGLDNNGMIYRGGTFYMCYGMVRCILPETLSYIAPYSFYHCASLKNIEIPDNVTEIGEGSFSCCRSLEKVKLPSGLTRIEDSLFRGDDEHALEPAPNQIKSIGVIGSNADLEIPNSVTSIGGQAFAYSTNLKAVVLHDNIETIEQSIFRGCSGLTSCTIGSGVTSIGGSAFLDCSSLSSINIPNSVTSIGEDAFMGCISLPITNNIRYADTYAVYTVDKTLSTYTLKNNTKWIGTQLFSDCQNATNIDIPNTVIYIGGEAFYRCINLTSVNIPSGVTTIGAYTFYQCSGLTNAITLDNVTTIGEYAFNDCYRLTGVTIGSGITYIGYQAFYYCGLKSITIKAVTPPEVGDEAFYGSNCPIYVPSESVNDYKEAFGWSRYYYRIQPIP